MYHNSIYFRNKSFFFHVSENLQVRPISMWNQIWSSWAVRHHVPSWKWQLNISAYLAISALLFASSAIWLSSVKCVRSVNIFVSGSGNPCKVLCACAHWSSRCSFPKSFCLVKAIYKKWNPSEKQNINTQADRIL